MNQVVNVAAKLGSFTEPWVPKVIGELNGQHVKVAKTEGEYPWHHHEHEDELFWVIEGQLELHLRDPEERIVKLEPGEFFVVPRGIEHRPVGTASVVLFEPAQTRNTGNLEIGYTIEADDLERI